MLIARVIGHAAALPFLWAGLLAGYFSPPLAAALLAVAWRCSAAGPIARQALAAAHRARGAEPALRLAEQWLQRGPSPEIAAFAGLTALELDQTAAAADFLAQGRRLGADAEGLLELLEWLVAARARGGSALAELAVRFEARRDLNALVSRLVHTTLLWQDMMQRRFPSARRRGEHLLAVEEVPQARLALWALDRRDGQTARAEDHLRRAELDPPQKLYFQVLGSVAIGQHDEACTLLAELEQLDPETAAVAARAVAVPEEVPQ